MSDRQRFLTLSALIACHLVADRFAVPILYSLPVGVLVGSLTIGAVFGQLALVTAYAAWGTGFWFTRWLTTGLLTLLIWYTVTAGAVSTGDSFEVGSIEGLLAIVALLAVLTLAVILTAVRLTTGWRIETPSTEHRPARTALLHFTTRDLLLGMAAAAAALTVVRSPLGREIWKDWTISPSSLPNLSDLQGIAMGMSLWSLICASIAAPTAWASMNTVSGKRWLPVVVVCAIILSAVEWAVARFIDLGPDSFSAFLGLNFGVFCQVLACGSVLRLCGYRCIRKRNAKPP